MTKFDRFFWIFILIEAIGIIGSLYMPVGYGLIICWVGGAIWSHSLLIIEVRCP